MNNFLYPSVRRHRGEQIGNIIVNLIGFWILSMVPGWELNFLGPDYMAVLTVMQFNCIFQAVSSVILIITGPRPVMNILKIAMETSSIVVFVMLYYLYPFHFAHFNNLAWLDMVLPFVFIIGILVSLLKIVNFVIRFVMGSRESEI